MKHIEKELSLSEVSDALAQVCTQAESIILTAHSKEIIIGRKAQDQERKIHTLDEFFSTSSTKEEFCLKLEYFPEHLAKTEKETRGQAINPLWFSIRQHMISASKAHDVKTRMASYHKDETGKGVDMQSIIDTIAGRKKVNPLLPSLRYGQAMENDAVQAFVDIYEKSHTNVKVEECGIFLCQDMPFVGGSPDRILSCQCCGKSCLEVKCPFSITHLSPVDAEAKLPYLKKDANLQTFLNRNHKYYTQCKVQMAASRIYTSYFFVWTSHGYFV